MRLQMVFDPRDVIDVMQSVLPYLKSEPMLIEDLPFDVAVVGDIHGQVRKYERPYKASRRLNVNLCLRN